ASGIQARRSGDQTTVGRITDVDPIDRAAPPPGGFLELLGDRQAGGDGARIETKVQGMSDRPSAHDKSESEHDGSRQAAHTSLPSFAPRPGGGGASAERPLPPTGIK